MKNFDYTPWYVSPKSPCQLSDFDTEPPSKELPCESEWENQLVELGEQLNKMQSTLHAAKTHGLLVIFQGMDTAGKDGVIRSVFTHISPLGVRAEAFGVPTELENRHDFLWRVHQKVPQRGQLTIFNRSHYEDILVPSVRESLSDARRHERMQEINAFERLLVKENNTLIFKFFMHVSKAEQEAQLKERLEDPTKFWKHNEQDWEERKHWDRYQRLYEYILNRSEIPWHVCPVDDRWYRDYVIASRVVAGLEALKLSCLVDANKV
jgi:PPK2 family polyphosphate:nucleotide phosphotransferase